VSRWTLPDVTGPGAHPNRPGAAGDAARNQAWENGFTAGRAEGYEAGRREGFAAGAEQMRSLLDSLARPLDACDEEVQQQLAALAIAVARQVIRRELQTQPGEVVAVIREALDMLPLNASDVRVHLHPEDAALLREMLKDSPGSSPGEMAWRLVEDAAVERGGCRVVTSRSRIDATVERRLNALGSRILGGNREQD